MQINTNYEINLLDVEQTLVSNNFADFLYHSNTFL